MDAIDKLAWLHLKDKRLLGARSKGKDVYYVPGGKREPGETDAQALLREIKEELAIDLRPASIVYAGTFKAQAHGTPSATVVQLSCYYADFNGEIQASAEIAEVIWLDYAAKAKCSSAAQQVMEWLFAKGLLD
jgi:8-oxo-dGTP diphosphatase